MKLKKIIFLSLVLICYLSLAEDISAQQTNPPKERFVIGAVNAKPPSPELKRRVEAFRFAWQTLNENYFDNTFNGLNWLQIKKEFEARVLQTKTDKELHDLLQEMIGRLDRSHLSIIPPEVFQTIEKAKREAKSKEKASAVNKSGNQTPEEETDEDEIGADEYSKYGIGAELRLINDKFVITRIEKDSAAEYAKLKPGYIIEKINDVSLDEMIWRIGIYYKDSKKVKKHLASEVTNWFLNGEEDTFVNLTVRDENDQPKDFKIRREKLFGQNVVIGKNYPEQHLVFESKSLGEDIGYIRFNIFALPVIEKFCSSLTNFKDKKAVILDLRGNVGGVLGTLVGLGGMLTDKSIDLGTSLYKIGSENLKAQTKAKNFKGKLIVLVDGQTYSAAEVFASALQENNRALVVGEKTAGEALPSVSIELPTGAVMTYPIANFKTPNGNFLEGKGVEPNFVVSSDRKSLLEGKDVQIETALRLIKENKSVEQPKTVVVELSEPPPPPAPKATPTPLKVLGTVTARAALPPPPPAPKPLPDVIEEAAKLRIEEFITAAGGLKAFEKLTSYTAKGTTIVGLKGSKTELDFQVYRLDSDKYAEFLSNETLGEVREIYSGNKHFVQSEYGALIELPKSNSLHTELFSPIAALTEKDLFKSLRYKGVFMKDGRKAHIVEAKTKDGLTLAFAFDAETKYLIGYATNLTVLSFSDYRKTGEIFLPYDIERTGIMTIKLSEIALNPKIEPGVFEKKENCYDKPD